MATSGTEVQAAADEDHPSESGATAGNNGTALRLPSMSASQASTNDVVADLPSNDHRRLKEKSTSREIADTMPSLHGEQAARRRAVAELIFFAGTNDLKRCRQIAKTWNIPVKDQSVMDYDRRTPLHVAAAEGAFSVVQWLVNEENANVNPIDRHQKTPLEEAARNDHTEVVQLLMEKKACVVEGSQLVPIDKSKMHGVVNMRRHMLTELGWDPEWEVNPKELKLIEKIGSGEFGDVFRAKWHGSFIAAKLLKRSDEIALGDFRTEIAILRKIHHPNTTQFLGACTKQKPYIVITELMACSLADAFQRTLYALSPRRKVEIALDFARGLAYLHSRRQPIVHRDLKPANLMISGNLHADVEQLYLDSGVIKVADFGLSKSLTPVDKHNQLNLTATYKLTGETGSYRYMAPEVFRHEPYSLKVDVYSYAMIVFQLFECAVPFSGIDPVEAAREAALSGCRPNFPPRHSLTDLDKELRMLVIQCWDGDADKRPGFEEIISKLEGMLKLLPKHMHFNKSNNECCTLQ